MTQVSITDGIHADIVGVPEGADMDRVALDWLSTYEIPEPINSTVWVRAEVWALDEEDDTERVIGSAVRAVDPDEPSCTSGEHDWVDVGVLAHGGGVESHDRCQRCGVERIVDTWATDPATGEQGLRSVSYRPAS